MLLTHIKMYKVVINTKFRIVATSEKARQERNQEGLYEWL